MNKDSYELMNERVKLVIRPNLGGRIDSFVDRKTQKEWVWHPPDYNPKIRHTLPRGTVFDERWTGGWDDIFPSDEATVFQGRSLYDHGELWSQPWYVLESSPLRILMSLHCESLPVAVEKSVALGAEQSECCIKHRLYNQSDEELAFIFKQHPALAIEEGDELLMPACELEAVALGFSMIAGSSETTRFPFVRDGQGNLVRMDKMRPRHSHTREFLYAKNLAMGWCGIRNHRTQTELLFTFDTKSFPYVWLFTSFSGFRDHYVAILEPCTNIPFDLETAYRQKTCGLIPAHGTIQYETHVKIQEQGAEQEGKS